ncbi:hypothetical protein D9611_013444 [Ephemerocybe angulata]|uniref:Uncharacterized protein n=1 Tax=Ephemerocybe angulata TaxID=980116 RepID=A0A8H5BUN0_9AGAR|nr:hypothetical protein D9611_013444 [Tulosesus angulatus]
MKPFTLVTHISRRGSPTHDSLLAHKTFVSHFGDGRQRLRGIARNREVSIAAPPPSTTVHGPPTRLPPPTSRPPHFDTVTNLVDSWATTPRTNDAWQLLGLVDDQSSIRAKGLLVCTGAAVFETRGRGRSNSAPSSVDGVLCTIRPGVWQTRCAVWASFSRRMAEAMARKTLSLPAAPVYLDLNWNRRGRMDRVPSAFVEYVVGVCSSSLRGRPSSRRNVVPRRASVMPAPEGIVAGPSSRRF